MHVPFRIFPPSALHCFDATLLYDPFLLPSSQYSISGIVPNIIVNMNHIHWLLIACFISVSIHRTKYISPKIIAIINNVPRAIISHTDYSSTFRRLPYNFLLQNFVIRILCLQTTIIGVGLFQRLL